MEASENRKPNKKLQDREKQMQTLLQEIDLEEKEKIEKATNEITLITKNIHVSYLFFGRGRYVLKKICTLLIGTRNWQSFARQLGIEEQYIKVIEERPIIREDLTYNLLAHFAQHDDASIDKIAIALKQIERYDIITQMSETVIEFGKELNNYYNTDDNSTILKPNRTVPVPLVLSTVKYKYSEATTVENYNKIVLLTYETLSELDIYKIANELRKRRDGKEIGVIILEEHKSLVHLHEEKFVSNAIEQADFIVPIVTVDYLNLITSSSDMRDYSLWENIDNRYAKYIYKAMAANFMTSGVNRKIRCIVPQCVIREVQRHKEMRNKPELQSWWSSENLEKFAELILSGNM